MVFLVVLDVSRFVCASGRKLSWFFHTNLFSGRFTDRQGEFSTILLGQTWPGRIMKNGLDFLGVFAGKDRLFAIWPV
jgi:hypothetical protein